MEVDYFNDESELLNLGRQAFNEQRYDEAIEYLEKCYQQHSTLDIHYLIVQSYMKKKEFATAKDIFKEHYHDYIKISEGRVLYIQLLMYTHEFITARIFLHKYQELDEVLSQYIQDINRDESYVYTYYEEEYQSLVNQLSQIHQLNYIEQVELIKKVNYLPFEIYIHEIPPILLNEQVHITLRASLLNDLSQLGYDVSIEYLGFDQCIHSVIPKQLPLLCSSESFKVLHKQVELQLVNLPDRQQNLFDELPIIFSILYPLEDDIITDRTCFFNALLYQYGMSDERKLDKEFEKYIHILDRVQQIQIQIYNF